MHTTVGSYFDGQLNVLQSAAASQRSACAIILIPDIRSR
jgi:hypothetical protein